MLRTLLVPAICCVFATGALADSAYDAAIKDSMETIRRLDQEMKQQGQEYAVWCPSMNSYIKLSDPCPPSQ